MNQQIAGTWNPGWDTAFATREWGKYPSEPIVRFVARNFYARKDRAEVRILDLGCGTGGVAWYAAREGFSVTGLDGSETGLAVARKRFEREGLRGDLTQGDFTQPLPFPTGFFDATIDNVAICHNPPDAVARTLAEIKRVLKPGGQHFGMMFAPGCTGESGAELIAPNTYRGVKEGPLAGPWPILFATEPQLRDLFRGFASLGIDRQSYTDGNQSLVINHWLVQATA